MYFEKDLPKRLIESIGAIKDWLLTERLIADADSAIGEASERGIGQRWDHGELKRLLEGYFNAGAHSKTG